MFDSEKNNNNNGSGSGSSSSSRSGVGVGLRVGVGEGVGTIFKCDNSDNSVLFVAGWEKSLTIKSAF